MTSTPLPEQGSFNERLDDALALIKYSVEYRETHGGCPPEVSAIKRHGVAEAKAAIRTLVLEEIIGEPEEGMQSKVTKTENGYIIDEWGDIASGFRNELRADQRKKLEAEL